MKCYHVTNTEYKMFRTLVKSWTAIHYFLITAGNNEKCTICMFLFSSVQCNMTNPAATYCLLYVYNLKFSWHAKHLIACMA